MFHENIFILFQLIDHFDYSRLVHFSSSVVPYPGKFGVPVKIARMRRYISLSPRDLATTIPITVRTGPGSSTSLTTSNALWSHAIVRMAIDDFSIPLLKERLLRPV